MTIHGKRIRGVALAVLCVLVLGTTMPARGQLYTADPYDPPGRGFRQYVYPGAGSGDIYGNSFGFRNRDGVRANQLERADEDLGFPTTGLRARRSGYDSAYHSMDREYGREYIPNEKADRRYIADREARERAMIRATLERDPAKRDQMVREAEREARKGVSDVSLSVRRTNPDGSAIPPAPTRGLSRSAGGGRAAQSGAATAPPAPAIRRAAPSASSATSTPPAPSVPRSATSPGSARTRSDIPAAPPLSRSSSSRSYGDLDPLPTEVLDRAQSRSNSPRSRISTRRVP